MNQTTHSPKEIDSTYHLPSGAYWTSGKNYSGLSKIENLRGNNMLANAKRSKLKK